MKRLLLALALLFPLLAHSQQIYLKCVISTNTNCPSSGSNPGNGTQGTPIYLGAGAVNTMFSQTYGASGNPGGGTLFSTGSWNYIDILAPFTGTKDSSHCAAGDGTMISCTGGGGTPGGTNGQIQYNNSGVFGGLTLNGSGNPAGTTGAVLVTPTLGAALATSINGDSFTAGTWTLNGAAGKTLLFNNSLTLAGTDGTTMTFPGTSQTIGGLSTAQTWTALQTFTNSDFAMLGSSTGKTTVTSANASSTSYTATVPAANFTFAGINLAETYSALQTFGTNISIGGVTPTGVTGTGNLVFGTSPTFVTPALGTPASGVATNLTGTAASLTAGTATVANGVKSATTTVTTSAATAPTIHQVLTALTSTTADWETPAAGSTAITPGTWTVSGATAPCILNNSTGTMLACTPGVDLTGLTNYTTPISTDLFLVYDITNSLSKKITEANLATALATTAGAAITVAHGTVALGTGAISSATCATAVTATATGTVTTDVVDISFNGDPSAVTGYIPSTSGMLTIFVYPTANTVNAKVCNNTAGSITPGAITLNWAVRR